MTKKIIYILFFLNYFVNAQSGLFINGFDASLKVDSNSFLSIDGDFYNMKCEPTANVRFNGSLYLTGSFINNDSLKFTATAGIGNSKKARIIFKTGVYTTTMLPGPMIGGTVSPIFWEVEFDRGTGSYLYLANNVRCLDTLTFKSGLVYMNNYKWKMIDPVGTPNVINHPYIKNERNFSQFVANSINDTGQVIYNTIYSQSVNINPANIGIEITGLLNIGSPLKIIRGFKPQVNAVKHSIQRYFDIYSSGHSLVNNTLKIRYSNNDMSMFPLNSFDLNSLSIYAAPNTDMNWSELSSIHQNTLTRVSTSIFDGVMTVQLSDLNHPNINIAGEAFRITIADPDCLNPPISALILDTMHICVGDTIILDAGNMTSISNTSLKWEWKTTPAVYTRTILVVPNSSFQKYNVSLKDVRGCVTKDSVVIAPASPFPQITYLNHLNACFGDSVFIKDTVKISSGTYSNFWLFSDSDTNSTSKQAFKKMFQNVGSHAYQLTATSNHGCSVTATSTNVIVYPLPTASFTSGLNCSSHLTTFSNTSVSNYSSLVISSSQWNLGLGSTNTTSIFSPSQTYSVSGNYSIQLKVTSSFGCLDSVSQVILIQPTNQAQFVKNNSCLGDTVYFLNTSACNTGSCNYTWFFGDGTNEMNYSTKKVYPNSGMYQVKLKMSTSVGCPDSTNTVVFVNPKPNAQFSNSTNTICVNEFVYFTNTSTISIGSIISYVWDYANTFTTNAINGATSFSLPGLYTVSLTALSDSGCVQVYSSPIQIPVKPIAQFNVNTVCLGSPSQFISSSTGNNLVFVWDFGNSIVTSTLTNISQIYTYPSAANYSTQLIVFDTWGCSDTSAAIASVITSPTNALNGNLSTCGSFYSLDAGNSGATFYWQPGNQTSQLIITQTSGLYQVVVTNSNGCSATQSVNLILNAIVKPHLGNDTIVCGHFQLDAGYSGSVFSWNTGDMSQTLLANSSGSYAVQVTDLNGCFGADTINVNILSPAQINLGNNLNICKPKYEYILTPTTNAQSFVWNTGNTNSSILIESNGLYWCDAILTNGCIKRDSIQVNFLQTPNLELGPDKSACGSIVLDAQNNTCNYLWSNGSSNQILSISTSSIYWVTVTNTLNNCFQSDSIAISIHPEVKLFLGNDTTLCNNTNFKLNASNEDSFYSWTTGASSQFLDVTSSGVYGVTVTSINGCKSSDYIQISLVSAPEVDLGNSIKYICGDSPVELRITNQGNTKWNSTTSLSSTSNAISTNQAGKYWVTVTEFGCSASDTVIMINSTNTIQASFLASTRDTINKPVQFVNLTSPPPISQVWSFGDGTTSSELNPLHTFVIPKNYSVTLEVSNGFCYDRLTKELNALFKLNNSNKTTLAYNLELINVNVYPNPSSKDLIINLELNNLAEVSTRLMDLSGRLVAIVESNNLKVHTAYFDLSNLTNGVYLVSLFAKSKKGNIQRNVKVIKVD